MASRWNQNAALGILAGALALGPVMPAHAEDDSMTHPNPALVKQAREILETTPLIDGHNDVPWQYRERVKNHLDQIDFAKDTGGLNPPMHTDLPRLRAGGVGGQFWSVYISVELAGPGAARAVLEQIDLARRLITRYSDDLELALTAGDIERIHRSGKIASLLGMEGGHSIENSLAVLRQLYRTGARYMTLTHWQNTDWADSATDVPEHGGLTAFGREVVREMNRLGMLVDLSHVSPDTMNDALDISEAPVVFSHSSARALCEHPRNVPDDVLSRLPENGGAVLVTFVPIFLSTEALNHSFEEKAAEARFKEQFLYSDEKAEKALEQWKRENPPPKATLQQAADHIDHIRKVAGIDHVGIGGDFDGIKATPAGLEDVSTYPELLAELLRRGYSPDDVRKVAGLNVLRVLREAEVVAEQLEKTRSPSDALFEELDAKPQEPSP